MKDKKKKALSPSQKRVTKPTSNQVKRSISKAQYFVLENESIVSIHYSRTAALDEMQKREKNKSDFITIKRSKKNENE